MVQKRKTIRSKMKRRKRVREEVVEEYYEPNTLSWEVPLDVWEIILYHAGTGAYARFTRTCRHFSLLWRENSRRIRMLDRFTVFEEDVYFRGLKVKQIYTVNGWPHRNYDLPAVINADGTQWWYKNGQIHREGDLHAIILANGTQEWWKNGQRHREGDLPAWIRADGSQQEWYKNNQRHREGDLPAWISANGSQAWYKNGQRHRDGDLPAVIWPDGHQEWWKNGKRYDPQIKK